jgi:hypothetical protein
LIIKNKVAVHRPPANTRAARDENGSILILTALSMMVLLGIAALSVDASYMYDMRNKLSEAADAAAKTGASEVHRNSSVSLSDLRCFAKQQVSAHGLTPNVCGSTGDVSVTINHPPASGPFAGNAGFVEAIVSRNTSMFFAKVLGFPNVTPSARAVAGISGAPGCMVTLAPGNPGITVSNPVGTINAPGCAIVDGGNLNYNGNTPIVAQSVGYSGVCNNGCTGATQVPAPTDPFESLPAPSTAQCNNGLPNSDITITTGITTISAGTYRNITFNGPSGQMGTLTMGPGLYCITGTVGVKNAGSIVNWNDTGRVTIYLGPSARLTLDSNQVNITLQAQNSGPYKAILFYQDRSNSGAVEFSKNIGSLTVDGVMYFPKASVELNNQNFQTSNLCGLFVAGSIDMAKPTMQLANQCGSFGGSPITTVSMGE